LAYDNLLEIIMLNIFWVAPDALVRHVGGDIVRRMRAEGFTPVGWKPLWRRPAALDAFNERNINQVWKSYLYRLVDRLFAFGPAIALLMRDDAPVAGLDSHERMRAIKGASQPELVKPGTIRSDLDSTNIMLALMHSSDTAAESAQESRVFTGPEGLATGDVADLWALIHGMELGFPQERRGFEGVLAGVRARVIGAIWESQSITGLHASVNLWKIDERDRVVLPQSPQSVIDVELGP